MIKAVIIDDESYSIETLQWKIETYCQDVEVVATFDDPVKGLAYLKDNPPEILFLDIEMPMLNGFDILEGLGAADFSVIFTTAYDNYGIQAVKFSALDYLLKPVRNTELQEAVNKFKQKSNHSISNEQVSGLLNNVREEKEKGVPGRIALSTRESIEFVAPEDIILCSSESNYTMVYLSNGRRKLISRTLKDFEEMLSPFHFYRPHLSHLVNLSMIREFVRSDGGYLVMKNQMKIPVSKSKKEHLLKMLQ
ncbi:MAG: LytTR family DNA-binding domain-containing protein [Bacteroidota bacterium]